MKEREEQILALTNKVREELDDLGEDNPILSAESAPNRFNLLSLFFTDSDGVQVQEDLDLNEIKVNYFTDEGEVELTEGAVYDWAVEFYKQN